MVGDRGGVIDSGGGADKLISECPSVSGASRGQCLTGLTDKSCQGDVCNIEQELKVSWSRGKKCCPWEKALISTTVYSGLLGVSALWTFFFFKKKSKEKCLSYHLNFPLLRTFWSFEMMLSFCVCHCWRGGGGDGRGGGGGGLPTSHHRWGAKRLWTPSGENVSLNWMC